MIATQSGEMPVERLVPGTKIVTRDNGLQELRWIGRRFLSHVDLGKMRHLHPVLLRKGALGGALPDRDLMVSPNHRILVANERSLLHFEEHEVFVAAKHLVNNSEIFTASALGVTYVHFMFERHEVVMANGSWTECFHSGDQALGGLGNSQRNEIFEIFPELAVSSGRHGYSARQKLLKRSDVPHV